MEAGLSTQNVTLSLPKDMLRRAKVLAAQQGTSVSRMLSEALERIVSESEAYGRARRRHVALLKTPSNLGTRGRVRWRREALHER